MELLGLQKGNLVSTDRGNVRIEKFAYNEIRGFINNIGHSKRMFGFEIKNINPIPLTEEWLVKTGAKKFNTTPSYISSRFKLIWKEGYKYWYVVDRIDSTYLTKIEFVHEWQNFCFILDGQELEIKEG
jgi:hypothetical protein